MQVLLQELPNGHNYRLSENGHLLWNGYHQQQQGEYNRRGSGPVPGPVPGPNYPPHMMVPQPTAPPPP